MHAQVARRQTPLARIRESVSRPTGTERFAATCLNYNYRGRRRCRRAVGGGYVNGGDGERGGGRATIPVVMPRSRSARASARSPVRTKGCNRWTVYPPSPGNRYNRVPSTCVPRLPI